LTWQDQTLSLALPDKIILIALSEILQIRIPENRSYNSSIISC